jgi:hypothetical protein
MRALTFSCLAIVSSCAFAAAACDNPSIPKIPEGKSATMDQLLAAQGEVKAYMAAMETFLSCIDAEAASKGDDAPADYKTLMVTRHNTAVTEMETLAASFNEQVKAFKAANPAK